MTFGPDFGKLAQETRDIITEASLASMQPRALLVNTSRSGLIAPSVLEAEVARGRISAAVDVFLISSKPALLDPNP